ncbi:MAG TPA: hypothetical protein VK835_07665 [Bacteroidia bacterium]|jgi:hypothetical protein|nr:hypothetical protein [Bacteroidia bacterium]
MLCVSADDKNETRLNSLKIICQQVFGGQTSLNYSQTISAIMQQTNKGRTSAKNYFIDMKAYKMVVKGEDKRWRINNNSTDLGHLVNYPIPFDQVTYFYK